MRKLIDALKFFGLSEYEARVLLALIVRGELTAKEIAEYSGVPRTSVYDVIRSLMEKGLVESYGKPMKFRTLNAEDLMKVFSKKLEEKLTFLRKELSMLEERREFEKMEVYRGDIVFDKIIELINNAKKVEIIATQIPEKILEFLKNCKCNIIACASNVDSIRNVVREGYRFKFSLSGLKHGLIVIDDKIIIIFFESKIPIAIIGSGDELILFYRWVINSIISSDLVEKL